MWERVSQTLSHISPTIAAIGAVVLLLSALVYRWGLPKAPLAGNLFLSVLASVLSIVIADTVEQYLGLRSVMASQPPPASAPVDTSAFGLAYDEGRRRMIGGDNRGAIQKYLEALNVPGINTRQRAQALKAIGYAHFRAGDYKLAEQALNDALMLGPVEPLVHVNLIKVMCALHEPPEKVQQRLRYLRSFAPAYGHDAELMSFCAYAGITPDFH